MLEDQRKIEELDFRSNHVVDRGTCNSSQTVAWTANDSSGYMCVDYSVGKRRKLWYSEWLFLETFRGVECRMQTVAQTVVTVYFAQFGKVMQKQERFSSGSSCAYRKGKRVCLHLE